MYLPSHKNGATHPLGFTKILLDKEDKALCCGDRATRVLPAETPSVSGTMSTVSGPLSLYITVSANTYEY